MFFQSERWEIMERSLILTAVCELHYKVTSINNRKYFLCRCSVLLNDTDQDKEVLRKVSSLSTFSLMQKPFTWILLSNWAFFSLGAWTLHNLFQLQHNLSTLTFLKSCSQLFSSAYLIPKSHWWHYIPAFHWGDSPPEESHQGICSVLNLLVGLSCPSSCWSAW